MFTNLSTVDWPTAIMVAIVTSFIFLLFIALFRPIVHVSKQILWSMYDKDDSDEQEKLYKIKVVNWTMANIYDVKIELYLATLYGDGDGTFSVRYKEVPFYHSEFLYIPSMIWARGRKHAEYAQIFITIKDIEELWKPPSKKNTLSQYLEFRMVAKHGLSGFNKVIVKQFTDRDVIKKGKFEYGISTKCKET